MSRSSGQIGFTHERVSVARAGAVLVIGLVARYARSWCWRARTAARFALEPDADQNVLLVTIDTLRADALSSYGGPAQTPNLDRLAAHGARFTFAHSHTVVTLPSHTSILSGLLPYEHGMRDNSGFRVRAGHADAGDAAQGARLRHRRVRRRLSADQALRPDARLRRLRRPDAGDARRDRDLDARAAAPTWSSSRALDWIGAAARRSSSPGCTSSIRTRRTSRRPISRRSTRRSRTTARSRSSIARSVRCSIALATLSRPDARHRHRRSRREPRRARRADARHVRLRGDAARAADRRARSSRGAPRRAPGVVIDAPVRHIDIVPTVLDAVGAEPDPKLPGASLRAGDRRRRRGDRPGYFESMTYNLVRGWAPLRGVLAERNKYIDLPIPELYDLRADPKEASNLAPAQRDRVAGADQPAAHLQRRRRRIVPGREIRRRRRRRCKSLGYVQGSAPARATYTEADDPEAARRDRSRPAHRDDADAGRPARRGDRDAEERDRAAARHRRRLHLARRTPTGKAGQPELAIAALEQALASGAPDRDVRIRLGIYLAESHADSGARDRAARGHVGRGRRGAERPRASRTATPDATATRSRRSSSVLALDPTNGLAYQNLASMVLRQALASTDESAERARSCRKPRRFARKAIDVDPALPDAFTTLGVVLSTVRPQGRSDRQLEARRRARRRAVQRALQPLVRARRGRPPRRGVRLRPPVRRHRPARLLRPRHRAHPARTSRRRGLTPAVTDVRADCGSVGGQDAVARDTRYCGNGSGPVGLLLIAGRARTRPVSWGGCRPASLRVVLQNMRTPTGRAKPASRVAFVRRSPSVARRR